MPIISLIISGILGARTMCLPENLVFNLKSKILVLALIVFCEKLENMNSSDLKRNKKHE